MPKMLSIQELWDSAPLEAASLRPDDLAGIPETARRYLEHAIAVDTPLASAIRLRMHGEIKLQRWLPFTAEQVIVWGVGFIWKASVRMFGLPIRGSDRLVDEAGTMQWRLLGIVPVMTAGGPDIDRSAAGRMGGEAVWLPSAFLEKGTSWEERDQGNVGVRFTAHGEDLKLELSIDPSGALEAVMYPRWGNPDGTGYRYVQFGGIVEDESEFAGYKIPTRLRIGWYIGTDRFETEGEFFRATLDNADYR